MTTVRPARSLLVDHLDDALAGHDVEAGDRLVEQQDVGLLGQALGHQHPLALTARQVVELAGGEIGDVEALERHGRRSAWSSARRRPEGPTPRTGPCSPSPAR